MSSYFFTALHRTLAASPAIAALFAIASPDTLSAQGTTYYACYVPSSGTVYRIKEPGLPAECGTSNKKGVTLQHVEFSWTDGQGAQSDHGALAGLADDDHAQYLLADGVRNSTNGFAVTGSNNVGSIPATGEGIRLMWYPAKSAFRAGGVLSGQWDDANIGRSSVAMGWNSMATDFGSVALGVASFAGPRAAALVGGRATGYESFAVSGEAAGLYSVAIGHQSSATGEKSMAFGTVAKTDGHLGAIVFADGSSLTPLKAVSANQFVVRAGRYWFGNDNNVTATFGRFIETSTGAYLSTGGAWTNSSDVNRKTAFEDVNSDALLAKVASMPVRTWSYKDEDSAVRHIGPTAQDFSATFGLGGTDKAIATVDADGVSLAAIQALDKRTQELKREIAELRALAERTARFTESERK